MNLRQIAEIAQGKGSLDQESREAIVQEACNVIEGGYSGYSFNALAKMNDQTLCRAFIRSTHHWLEQIVESID